MDLALLEGFTEDEQSAYAFADRAHEGQLRKYTFEPYITHPLAVANIVRSVPYTTEMVQASLLHDVVEDTPVTHDEIVRAFGPVVGSYVWFLTNVDKTQGNRATRKVLDMGRLMEAPADVQTVKLADLIHNMGSIIKYDPNFAKVYLREKKDLLEVLKKGDPRLWNQAYDLAEGGLNGLHNPSPS